MYDASNYLKAQRVIVVAVDIPPNEKLGVKGNGGASIYVQDLLRFYEKSGAEVALVTSVKEQTGLSDNLRARMAAELHRLILERKPILLHVLYWKSARIVLDLPECTNIRKIFSPISLAADKQKGDPSATIDSARWSAERDIIRQSAMVTAVSANEARIVQDDYGLSSDRTAVVMRTIDLNVFSPGDTSDADGIKQKYILYVGRFASAKGINSLINVYFLLSLKTTNTPSLVLAGGTDADIDKLKLDMKEALTKIDRAGGKVIFLGHVEQNDLPALYRGAFVTCIPSRYEPGSRVMLETMACGTPVLTTPTGYIGELNNSILKPAPGWALELHSDYKPWVSALYRLCKHPEAAALAGINARKFAEDLVSFPDFCKRHTRAIQTALKRS